MSELEIGKTPFGVSWGSSPLSKLAHSYIQVYHRFRPRSIPHNSIITQIQNAINVRPMYKMTLSRG